eukprot:TRINITY_DN1390_c0_g2_i3.p1 TRINITY_DN1390_c0_g2~~TRINITY_DN1390_c0_g2_i3.p1  ORF type:complete len:122 (-),score=10.23 TRINITY_DN1390_c0_g2_i3:6-371(-)
MCIRDRFRYTPHLRSPDSSSLMAKRVRMHCDETTASVDIACSMTRVAMMHVRSEETIHIPAAIMPISRRDRAQSHDQTVVSHAITHSNSTHFYQANNRHSKEEFTVCDIWREVKKLSLIHI